MSEPATTMGALARRLRCSAWVIPVALSMIVAIHQRWRMHHHEQVAAIGGGYGMFSDHHQLVAFAHVRSGDGWLPVPPAELPARLRRWAEVAPTHDNVATLAHALLHREWSDELRTRWCPVAADPCPTAVRVEVWRVGLEHAPLRIERRLWRSTEAWGAVEQP